MSGRNESATPSIALDSLNGGSAGLVLRADKGSNEERCLLRRIRPLWHQAADQVLIADGRSRRGSLILFQSPGYSICEARGGPNQ
jgi:hypothetical protein